MRFVDANVFIYAFAKPRKKPPENVKDMKAKAQEIVKKISEGEKVVTTVVHLSEVANVLESRAGWAKSAEIMLSLMTSESIEVLSVSAGDYLKSALIAKEKGIDINDALAYFEMKKLGIKEIYTFDKTFKRLDVVVLP